MTKLNRELTEAERTLVETMIRRGVDTSAPDATREPVSAEDRERWLEAVPQLRVVGGCGCGRCPSISFTPDEEDFQERRILEAGTPSCYVILFIDDDALSFLEVCPLDDVPVELPAPEELDFGAPANPGA